MVGAGALSVALEDGRYFDPQTQVVYHVETAEVFLITGIVLIVAGLGIAGASFRFFHARERSAKS